MSEFYAVHTFSTAHSASVKSDNVYPSKIKYVGRVVADSHKEAQELLNCNIAKELYHPSAFIIEEDGLLYG